MSKQNRVALSFLKTLLPGTQVTEEKGRLAWYTSLVEPFGLVYHPVGSKTEGWAYRGDVYQQYFLHISIKKDLVVFPYCKVLPGLEAIDESLLWE